MPASTALLRLPEIFSSAPSSDASHASCISWPYPQKPSLQTTGPASMRFIRGLKVRAESSSEGAEACWCSSTSSAARGGEHMTAADMAEDFRAGCCPDGGLAWLLTILAACQSGRWRGAPPVRHDRTVPEELERDTPNMLELPSLAQAAADRPIGDCIIWEGCWSCLLVVAAPGAAAGAGQTDTRGLFQDEGFRTEHSTVFPLKMERSTLSSR
mmetsp:Transcript_12471/g.35029  ORF Transcript_12471/g.35029 Transcript_12471/m.35029 type:complete len:213 (-) Transcript_12471:129-767(-)